jgi:hypothetical protein
MPRIEYGPPGHKGVTSIMGLGALDIEDRVIKVLPPSTKPLRDVMLGSGAVWLFGLVTGSNTAKNVGLGAIAAVFMVKTMMKARDSSAAPAPSLGPQTTQGW